ncbi:delta-60 repeat domain-containing protein/Por secretion system C-terminal sorting domain-containing protein [Lishizhenia tianjinensis]|uniref:Delta-60 repeat domain-containing protein/Por secretion system C-terminal sorting domain-containing protein n=1 Tax=Lishizhenia tianjinensis TaxID=477690 RepID=A0A1I6YAF7_9FLAO|nr:T9SS type A sorting domain-containing protein [Lishizhenia tianjinensis]SFT47505.1 delta-60 repeat domain-containing protein/Por secretion system C-terminal sorting domain-containing protein [Lishizhenia tianjinensis]
MKRIRTLVLVSILLGTNSFAQDISVDASYGIQGSNTAILNSAIETTANSLLQSNGKLLVVCKSVDSTYLVRFDSNGNLDLSFAQNGVLNLNIAPLLIFDPYLAKPSIPIGLTQQRDGKILVSAQNILQRFYEDGNIDPLFGINGRSVLPLASDHQFPYYNVIIEKEDRNILVMGTQNTNFNYFVWCGTGVGGPSIPTYIYSTQITPNGAIDINYGNEGLSHPIEAPHSSLIADYKVQADGKILLLTNYANSQGAGDYGWQQLYRFQTDGSIDNSFEAYNPNTLSYTQQGYAIDLLSDGKIICAGRTTLSNHYTLTRYNTDGTMDAQTNVVNIPNRILEPSMYPNAIALHSLDNDDIIVAAVDKEAYFPVDPRADTAVVVYFDRDFNIKHECEIGPFRAGKGNPSSLQIQEDGKILIAGIQIQQQVKSMFVSRYTPHAVEITYLDITVCDSYNIGKLTLDKPGLHLVVLKKENGCDSLIVIDLTIAPLHSEIKQKGNLLTALPAGHTYQWIDCKTSTPITGATAQTFRPSAHGTYAVIISSENCTEMSNCLTHFPLNVLLEYVTNSRVSPNPSQGQINIQTEPTEEDISIVITNTMGQVVYKTQVAYQASIPLDLNLPDGVYILSIHTLKGIESKKILIQR